MNDILELKNITYSIKGKDILKNISLSIKKGSFLTISGPSGSGKSTLLKIIASMASPTSGTISYKDKLIDDYQMTDYRKEVSYSFQNASLFGETVKENLAFPFEIRGEEFNQQHVMEALKMVQLPESYLDKKVTTLSGGEKQRIALIRNIIFLPEILLLDEVTSALDTENRRIIGQAIRQLNKEKGITVLWVTHNEEEIQESDYKIEIINGEIGGITNE
ncbi:ATP-binding cassette domain-containing protein [Jeotgalibaca sp. MA1X17-3]|uniref:ABC transporter ATP-binding protein n=1 Tax=Jeotgalibaca sp. MA1X17-3 TaxID=2908211 RepID=UPI001F3BAF05|nr:ATP-binding cassette domain-containing protein [Jeotgalibaca sp. MA1X17-3]UJF16310.1 ATP-binding cassette domain-containing protein [Jeotgalibaca sp. MA1X17-3]